jgi:endonuclease YncB( thermonuclease family)
MKLKFSALLLLLLLVASSAQAQLTVSRVIDGDTFQLSDGQRVRLIGIDTPETHASDKLNRDAASMGVSRERIQALGRLSTNHAEKMVLNRRVRLEYDQANAASGHKDRYGRTLAYVFVEGESVSVNERMIREGYANAYTTYAFNRALQERFRQVEGEARLAGRGLWNDNALTEAADGADLSQVVFITNTGTRYHRQGCRHLTQSSIPSTLAEVQGRYQPCGTCKPVAVSGGSAPAPSSTPRVQPPPSPPAQTGTRSASVQCSGTTQAGARCKRMTRSPNGRCHQHGGN